MRAYFLFIFGVLALAASILGPRIQAWYRTMPIQEAKGIGAGILFGLLIVVCVGAMIVASRSSDA